MPLSPMLMTLMRDASLELEEFVRPLFGAAKNPMALQRLLASRGWDLEQLVGVDLVRLANLLALIQNDLIDVAVAINAPDDAQLVSTAHSKFKSAVERFDGLYPIFQNLDPATPLNTISETIATELAGDLVELLILKWSARRAPALLALARLAGLVVSRRPRAIYRQDNPDLGALRLPMKRQALNWQALLSPAGNPMMGLLETVDLSAIRSIEDFAAAAGEAFDTKFAQLRSTLGRRGLDGMHVHLDHTGLSVIGGEWLPFLNAGEPPLQLSIDEPFVPALHIDDQRWHFTWLDQTPDDAGQYVLIDEAWIRLSLVSAVPDDSAAQAPGLHLFEENGHLALDFFGGAAISFPLDLLTDLNGDEIGGAVRGSVHLVHGQMPRLHLHSLSLAGSFRLGGSSGLVIEQAQLSVGNIEWPLPDNAFQSITWSVAGELVIAGTLRFDFKVQSAPEALDLSSSGRLDLGDGVVLHPVDNAPVVRATWQRQGHNELSFSVSGAIDIPSDQAATGVRRFAVSGQLHLLQADNGQWQVQNFAASGTMSNWSLPNGILIENATASVALADGKFEARVGGSLVVGQANSGSRVALDAALSFPDVTDASNIKLDAVIEGQNLVFGSALALPSARVELNVATHPAISGQLSVSGTALILPQADQSGLLTVANLDSSFTISAGGDWQLYVSSGELLLPPDWTLIDGTHPTLSLAAADTPLQLNYQNQSLFFSGALTVEELGVALPVLGDQSPRVLIEQARLIFSSAELPALANASGELTLPLSANKSLQVGFDNVSWALDGIPTGSLSLSDTLSIDMAGGFRLLLLGDGSQPGAPASTTGNSPTALHIEQFTDGVQVTISAGLALEAPLSALSSVDGDHVRLTGVGSVVFPPNGPPQITASSLMLAGTVHFGGPNGLVIENAALSVGGIAHLLNPTPQQPVIVSLSGSLKIPEGPTGTLTNATITLNGGQPEFDVDAIGVDASDMQLAGVLPVSVHSILLEFDDQIAFPEKLLPQHLTVTLGATINIGDVLSGGVDQLIITFNHAGLPQLSVDTVMISVEGLEMGNMILGGGLGIGGLSNPITDLVIAGKLTGKINGAGIEALAAFGMVEGVPAPLGAALDVSLGPGGIPLWATGILLTGVSGGVSFTGSNADPDDLAAYIQIGDDGSVSAQPIPDEEAAADVPVSQQVTTERAEAAPEAQMGDFACPDSQCPPPSVGILYQPHPDREHFSKRVIVKFTSLDRDTVDQLLQDAGLDKNQLASYSPSRIASDLRTAMFGWIGEQEFLSEQLDAVGDFMETMFREVIENATGANLYEAIVQAAYRGIPAQNVTTKLTGTISYTGVSSFASITGGVVLSPTVQSAGIVGSLNLLGIPVGQLRGFVTLNNAQGIPDPALCGDLDIALGPLELGKMRLRATYGLDVIGFSQAMIDLAQLLPDTVLQPVLAAAAPEALQSAANNHLDALQALVQQTQADNDPGALIGVLTRIMQWPDTTAVAEFMLQLFDASWDNFNPEWVACGSVQPKLFGLALGPEAVGGYVRVSKTEFRAQFRFSPTQLLSSVMYGLIPPSDQMAVALSLELPDPRPLLAAGMFATLDDAGAIIERTEDAFAHVLEHAIASVDYQLAPMGLKVAQLQMRLIMPRLLPHPAAPASGWTPPETRQAGLPSRLQVLKAALLDNVLSSVSWRGTPEELRGLSHLPGKDKITDESLRNDWFPYGGFMGAGRLTLPLILTDPPPVEALQTLLDASLPVMQRLQGAQQLINQVQQNREVGHLAFYFPAPAPPASLLGGAPSLSDIIRHMAALNLDVTQLGVLPEYPLQEAFLLGRLGQSDAPLTLLGIPLGEADLAMVPPGNGAPAHVRITASVPQGSWLRDFVDDAAVTFQVHAPPDRPITERFNDVQIALNNGQLTPAMLISGLSEGLPHVTLNMSINNFRIPAILASLIDSSAQITATLRACSPSPAEGPLPVDTHACLGPLGGILLSLDGSLSIGQQLGLNISAASVALTISPTGNSLLPKIDFSLFVSSVPLPFGMSAIENATLNVYSHNQVIGGVRPLLFEISGTAGGNSISVTSGYAQDGLRYTANAAMSFAAFSMRFNTVRKPGSNVALAKNLDFTAAFDARISLLVTTRQVTATVRNIKLQWRGYTIRHVPVLKLTAGQGQASPEKFVQRLASELNKHAWAVFKNILNDALTWAELYRQGVIDIGTSNVLDIARVIKSLTNNVTIAARALVRVFDDLGDAMYSLRDVWRITEVPMLQAIFAAINSEARVINAAWSTFQADIVDDLIEFLVLRNHSLRTTAQRLLEQDIDLGAVVNGLLQKYSVLETVDAIVINQTGRRAVSNLAAVIKALLDSGLASAGDIASALARRFPEAGASLLAAELAKRSGYGRDTIAGILFSAGFTVRRIFDALRSARPGDSVASTITTVANLAATSLNHLKKLVKAVKDSSLAGSQATKLKALIQGLLGTALPSLNKLKRVLQAIHAEWGNSADTLTQTVSHVMSQIGVDLTQLKRLSRASIQVWGVGQAATLAAALLARWSNPQISRIKRVCEALYYGLSGYSDRWLRVTNAVFDGWVGSSSSRARRVIRALVQIRGESLSRLKQVASWIAAAWGTGETARNDLANGIKSEIGSTLDDMKSIAKALRHALSDNTYTSTVRKVAMGLYDAWGSKKTQATNIAKALKAAFSGVSGRFGKIAKALRHILGSAQSDAERVIKALRSAWRAHFDDKGLTHEIETITSAVWDAWNGVSNRTSPVFKALIAVFGLVQVFVVQSALVAAGAAANVVQNLVNSVT